MFTKMDIVFYIYIYIYICVCVCVCVCVCALIYVCIWVCIYVYKYVYLCECTNIYICACLYIFIFICVGMCLFVWVYIYICVCVYLYIFICWFLYIYICIYIYQPLHTTRMQHKVNFYAVFNRFQYLGYHIKVKEPSLSYCLPIAGGKIVGFLTFMRVLALVKCKQLHSGFKLSLPCPFSLIVTITP